MPKIAVFDSGLGSLSVIRPIQKKIESEIIYFADQENFPYGIKSSKELRKIIKYTISKLEKNFFPDVIVIGSNTPSLLLGIKNTKEIGVLPPLTEASKMTRTKSIGILATKSVVTSKALSYYIKQTVPKNIRVWKINASPLVDLVESGKFISQRKFSIKTIKKVLSQISEKNVDTITLSSTHLPFLLQILKKIYPDIVFLDPAESIANRVSKMLLNKRSKKNRLKIYASGNTRIFQRKLRKLGIKNKVLPL